MTPRERMRAFLDGKPVDRIPNGLGGTELTGMHNVVYHRLKKLFGVNDCRNRLASRFNHAVVEPSVLEAMEGDIIFLGVGYCPSRLWGPAADKEWKPLRMWDIDLLAPRDMDYREDPDGTWWCDNLKCPPGGLYFDAPAGLMARKGLDDLDNPSSCDYHPTHEIPDPLLARLADDACWLFENTPYSISCGEDFMLNLQGKHGGLESWWMRMVTEPDACHEFLDKTVDAALDQLRQLDQAIGKYCDMLTITDDMADMNGVTIGPELWRAIYKPHYQRLFGEWHKITRMKLNFHSCGSVAQILDDLVECGVDVLCPVQISAKNMAPASLKKRFGDRLIFYGGAFDAVDLPATTSPDKVYETVKSNIRTFSRNGGYIFAGVHNLPGDLPESHVRAMLDAYHDCCNDSVCRKREE